MAHGIIDVYILIMNEDNVVLTIDLHYLMDKEDRHEMDASIHNKCGASIINVINHLGDVLDEDFQLDFSTSENGGVKDIYKLILRGRGSHEIFIALISALIGHFISVAPSVDETQKQLNRAEVIEKIKEGEYTEDEAAFVITGDTKYIENRNQFYGALDSEPHVSKVQCSTLGANRPQNFQVAEIEKKDFKKQIISEQTNKESQTYKGTSVMVLIPVLSKFSKAKWRGLFNNQEISFIIADKSFRHEVFNKDVHFVAGTSLKCDFTITTVTKYNKNGEIISENRLGVVDEVMSCYDGETLAFRTKKYKKRKADDDQLSLFSDEDYK